jgi:hypothetical protein
MTRQPALIPILGTIECMVDHFQCLSWHAARTLSATAWWISSAGAAFLLRLFSRQAGGPEARSGRI